MNLGITFILVLCAGMVTVLAILMFFEEKFIFFPVKYPAGQWKVENISGEVDGFFPKIEDCRLTATDGVNLHGWYCTPQRANKGVMETVPADAVLLWFHGNAGNITHRYDMIQSLMRLSVNVFIVDYRGYGKSEGSPTEQGLYRDAQGAWDYLTGKRGLEPRRIVIFGDSIGSAPAIDLAARVKPAGLIVQSGFTSLPDMAAAAMPFVPRLLIRSKMDSVSKIGNVRFQKLFIHSPADEIVPYRLGRRLFEAAPEPKQFYEVAGAPHNETDIVGGPAYFDKLCQFIRTCVQSR
jgi:hypothetical protein